ncbi:MAG: zinc ABC transporter substrate-binding protein [Planctomycetota bacterium]|nr:MAG: zinc ABC transporter substrate-binding protein [Planctomycetota bacterium]
MRKLFLCWMLLGLSPAAMAGQDPIQVVATTQDLASLARTIGGARVQVEALLKPGQDPHRLIAKASHPLRLAKADVLLLQGLDLEHAFLPAILERSRNKAVKPGGHGYMNVGAYIRPMEVPQHIDRSQAVDLHPRGNPHYHLDPENGRIMAKAVAQVFIRVDPKHEAEYRSRWQAWDEEAQKRIAEWERLMKPHRGCKILTYHRSWSYLAARYDLTVAGEIEPKPGLAPTPNHLAKLSRLVRQEQIPLLLMEPWYRESDVAGLVRATGISVSRVDSSCGGTEKTRDYLDFLDHLIRSLAGSLAKEPEKV